MNGVSQHELADNDSNPSAEAMDMQESQGPASPAGTDTVWGAPGPGTGWGSSGGTGWGYHDRNGWGLALGTANDQNRDYHITHSTALRNLRVDFNAANLSFENHHGRDTALDDVDTKVWASVQCYRSSKEARRGSSPHPSSTGRQVLDRLEEVKSLLSSRIHEQEALSKQVLEASSALAALRAHEEAESREIQSLRITERELEYLRDIAYARLL
ncbi:hypothetical protein EV361DRAFT_957015 [Lentinula raphanica]|nr:hypothetical protein EV361DRAFT_957015 [Lentinula raphanica]